jgi:O-antigen ligase
MRKWRYIVELVERNAVVNFFCFLLPLSQYLSVRMLVVLFILSLLVFDRPRVAQLFQVGWSCLLYTLILGVGMVHSDQPLLGIRILETSFPLLALPVVFVALPEITKDGIYALFKSFNLGLLTTCAILSVYAIYRVWFTSNAGEVTYYGFTDLLGFQPTYFSYYLVFGITFNLFSIYYEEDQPQTSLQALSTLVFFCCLLFSSSKTTFITLMLVLSFFLFRFLNEEKTKKKKWVVGIAVVMLVTVFAIQLGGFSWSQGDVWDRVVLWDASINAIPDIVVGAGTGADQNALARYFRSHDLEQYAIEGLNAHNQVLQVLLANGLMGLFGFLAMLVYPLYRAAKSQNMLTVISIFPFVVYGVTEVFLGRYQGIVFFAFLHQACSGLMASEQRLPLSTNAEAD